MKRCRNCNKLKLKLRYPCKIYSKDKIEYTAFCSERCVTEYKDKNKIKILRLNI